MKAAKLTDLRQMEIVEVDDPAIETPNHVLIEVKSVGVCGSDVHYYATGRIGSQVVQYPFSVGHEASGVVKEVGSAVTNVKPGDRIAIDPPVSCGECDQCRAGRPHTCRKLKYLGCPDQLEGCLSELLVMPSECCFPVPEHMSFGDAALVEPLSIGVYAMEQSIPMQGARIGILGMGPIGFSVMLPALAAGAAAVYATDRIDARCGLAASNGATWVGNPDNVDVVAEIEEHEPLLLDCVFECCGQQDAFDQGMAMLKPGGKLMLIGIPEDHDRYSFVAEVGRRNELCIQNVRRQNHCVQKAIDLVASADVDPSFMITHRFSLDETKKAFDLVDGYEDGVLKAVIDID